MIMLLLLLLLRIIVNAQCAETYFHNMHCLKSFSIIYTASYKDMSIIFLMDVLVAYIITIRSNNACS